MMSVIESVFDFLAIDNYRCRLAECALPYTTATAGGETRQTASRIKCA